MLATDAKGQAARSASAPGLCWDVTRKSTASRIWEIGYSGQDKPATIT